jgi:hypothetical protein
MSEAEQTAEATAPEPTKLDRKAVEEHPAFKGVAKRAASLEAKLAELEAATKAAEEARLQQQGEYKTLAEQRAAEISAIKAQHERELLTRDANMALVSAGLNHPHLRNGYVAEFLSLPTGERPSLTEWAEKIKADPLNAPLLSQVPAAPPVGAGPSAGAASRAGAGMTLAEIKEGLKDIKDQKRNMAARVAAREMIIAGKVTQAELLAP